MTVGSASGAYTATTDNGLPAQDGGILVQPASSNFTSTPSPTTVNLAAGQTTSPSWTMLAANVGSGSRTVGAAASGGINVTAKSVTVNPGSLAAGTATAGSVTTTTAAATATDASGGTTPYAYQWYRSTGSGTLGSAVSGQTTRTLADTGLSPSTAYYYTLRYADAASATVDSNQVAATTSASSASTGQLQAYHTTASLATVYFVIIKANGQAWNGTAFESLDSSHWATYAIAGSDAAGVKIYLAAMPSAIPAGWVTVATFIKAGGSAASTDTRFSGPERLYWDGTTLTPSAPGSFPSAAPDSWIHRASFAADAVQDGVMRATSTAGPPAVLHFSASDAKANALANGAVSQYIEILSGTGAGQVIPVVGDEGRHGAGRARHCGAGDRQRLPVDRRGDAPARPDGRGRRAQDGRDRLPVAPQAPGRGDRAVGHHLGLRPGDLPARRRGGLPVRGAHRDRPGRLGQRGRALMGWSPAYWLHLYWHPAYWLPGTAPAGTDAGRHPDPDLTVFTAI
jgi:hypothetical protein